MKEAETLAWTPALDEGLLSSMGRKDRPLSGCAALGRRYLLVLEAEKLVHGTLGLHLLAGSRFTQGCSLSPT